MASNDPRPTEPRHAQLSAEDAELFASKIRPSWELFDDAIRNDLAADLSGSGSIDAPPQSSPADTIIEGVPTLVIGEGTGPDAPTARLDADELPTAALDPSAQAAFAKPATGAVVAAPPAGAPSKVNLTVIDAEPERRPAPHAGKTRVGLGSDPEAAKPAAASSGSGPSSRRAVRAAAPASASAASPAAAVSARAASAPASATIPGDDDIQIPVTGAPGGLMLKLGLGAAALIALLGVGYMFLGNSKTTADTAPTATAVATSPTTTVTAAPTAPTVATPTPTTAAVPAAKAPAAITATPLASAAPSAAPTATAKASAPVQDPPKEPAPKAVAAPAEPKKPSKPPPAATPPPPKKGGGGIIRETPF